MSTTSALVVPDASVILKWVLPAEDEPHADRAAHLLDAFVARELRCAVPALSRFEVGNTIARRFPEEAPAWLDALERLGLDELVPGQRWLGTTLALTRTHGVTFHDAAYHAGAIELGGTFVTADTRYVTKAREAGAVVSLADWSVSDPAEHDAPR